MTDRMLSPKPPACLSCPLYGNGQGFVPDQICDGAGVTIVMQNPGADEEAGRQLVGYDGKEKLYESLRPTPAIGVTGYDMDHTYLPLAGQSRDRVSVCNVLKCRWQSGGKGSNDLPPPKIRQQAVEHCMAQHFRLPKTTQLIVAQGGLAMSALGGVGEVHEWRGHLLPNRYQGCPVYIVNHLADLYHEPHNKFLAMLDWKKIPRILDGTWPLALLESLVVDWHVIDRMTRWFQEANKAPYVAIDTEYHKETKDLYLVGLGIPGGYPTLQVEWKQCHRDAFSYFISEFKQLIQAVPCVFQNALADVPVLRNAPLWRCKHEDGRRSESYEHLDIDWPDYRQIHDTMQAHAVLWPELPHDLEFLASIYGQYPKAKHLSKIDKLRYNQGDVLETLAVWAALDLELDTDPASRGVYQDQLALLPIVEESMHHGIRVNPQRVEEALTVYQAKITAAVNLAHAYCGWPINLGSDDQLSHWLYTVEQLPTQKQRKRKGETAKKKKGNTIAKDAVATLREKVLVFDPDEEVTIESTLRRIEEGAHPLLEARVLYANAAQCVNNYLKPLVGE